MIVHTTGMNHLKKTYTVWVQIVTVCSLQHTLSYLFLKDKL